MAHPKIALEYEPYAMEPGSLDNADIPRYIEQELRKIENSLAPLTANYAPNLYLELKNPAAPTGLTTTPQTITNYTGQVLTHQVDKLGITYDPDTGLITLNGTGDRDVILLTWVTLNLDVSSFPQNNEIIARLHQESVTQGAANYNVGSHYRADPQQTIATSSATQGIVVPNDAVLSLEIYGSTNGAIAWLNGSFGMRYI